MLMYLLYPEHEWSPIFLVKIGVSKVRQEFKLISKA
jgi:hypothetical protein